MCPTPGNYVTCLLFKPMYLVFLFPRLLLWPEHLSHGWAMTSQNTHTQGQGKGQGVHRHWGGVCPKSSDKARRGTCGGQLGGGAGCGYHCKSDLAGLGVTVPLYFRGELLLKQNITQQCLEEMKSAQSLNLPLQRCTLRLIS